MFLFIFVLFCSFFLGGGVGRSRPDWNTNTPLFPVCRLTLLGAGDAWFSMLLSAADLSLSPLTVASSSGSPGFAALELDPFCTPLSQEL